MSEEQEKKAFKAYKKALRNHDWDDSDYSFYKWVDIEAAHDISPDSKFFKEFKAIWSGKAENYAQRMDIKEWEDKRNFYRNLCAYSKYW